MDLEKYIVERLTSIDIRLGGIEKNVGRICQNCARNDERIDQLVYDNKAQKRTVWRLIIGVVTTVLGTIGSLFVHFNR